MEGNKQCWHRNISEDKDDMYMQGVLTHKHNANKNHKAKKVHEKTSASRLMTKKINS